MWGAFTGCLKIRPGIGNLERSQEAFLGDLAIEDEVFTAQRPADDQKG
jgi:hypothetical protein